MHPFQANGFKLAQPATPYAGAPRTAGANDFDIWMRQQRRAAKGAAQSAGRGATYAVGRYVTDDAAATADPSGAIIVAHKSTFKPLVFAPTTGRTGSAAAAHAAAAHAAHSAQPPGATAGGKDAPPNDRSLQTAGLTSTPW